MFSASFSRSNDEYFSIKVGLNETERVVYSEQKILDDILFFMEVEKVGSESKLLETVSTAIYLIMLTHKEYLWEAVKDLNAFKAFLRVIGRAELNCDCKAIRGALIRFIGTLGINLTDVFEGNIELQFIRLDETVFKLRIFTGEEYTMRIFILKRSTTCEFYFNELFFFR